MRYQLKLFFTALMFLTRIPVPRNIDHNSVMLQKSARYFSWVGIVVGGIAAIVWYACIHVLSSSLSIAFSMLASILTTGAFHEDGFADCCDAFGGGWTKEKILTIMKDSRLGTYGVTGLIGIIGFKFLLLTELAARIQPSQICVLLVAAHCTSRLMAVSIMQQYEYVQDPDQSKSKPGARRKLNTVELVIVLAGAIIPLLLLHPLLWLSVIPMIVTRWFAGRYFKKWIGGYTGDCLGATQQITEVVFYLAVLLITPYL